MWPTEPSNPSKVRVFGPGVERGVKMNIPTYFMVDCKEAGPGKRKKKSKASMIYQSFLYFRRYIHCIN